MVDFENGLLNNKNRKLKYSNVSKKLSDSIKNAKQSILKGLMGLAKTRIVE
jgi:hypothetical protein